MAPSPSTAPDLPLRRILNTWWPLAASWLIMAVETPALSAVVSRLPDPEINLAAYGGFVFPVSMIIEAPIIMLLAASTALSKDYASYRKLRRFMLAATAGLTALNLLVIFTPLYYLVVEKMLGAPRELLAPVRLGLIIGLPWTWAIAYRRFNQGVLIRFGHSRSITVGTFIRLLTDLLFLAVGYRIGTISGTVVATTAITAGILAEAIYVWIVVRPVVQREVKPAPPVAEPVTLRSFMDFYIPLAMTSLLFLLVQPLGSAALTRMPNALASLAAWQVVSGLLFMLRSLGLAYNEVVVALLDEPGSVRNLFRFSRLLAGAVTLLLVLIAVTPLAGIWFRTVQGLSEPLARLALNTLWFTLPLPALGVFQSWYQGAIVNGRHTRGITEAVAVFLVVAISVFAAGVIYGRVTGIYFSTAGICLAAFAQVAWLWRRSRTPIRVAAARDNLQLAVAD